MSDADQLTMRNTELLEDIRRLLAGDSRNQGNSAGKLLSGTLKGAGASLQLMRQSTQTASYAVSSFAKAVERATGIAGLSGAAYEVIAMFRDMTRTYNKLSDLGQSFGGSMFEMQRQAGAAGVSLEEFARSIEKSSTVAAVMGSNSFGQMEKAVRNNLKEFGYYGMTLSQVDDAAGDLGETLRQTGFLTKQNSLSSSVAISGMITSANEFAVATGKSREEIMKIFSKEAREPTVGYWLSTQKDNIKSIYDQFGIGLAAASPELLHQFSENLINNVGSAMSNTGEMNRKLGLVQLNNLNDWYRSQIRSGHNVSARAYAEQYRAILDSKPVQDTLKRWQQVGGEQGALAERLMAIDNQMRGIDFEKRMSSVMDPVTQAANLFESNLEALTGAFRKGFFEGIIKLIPGDDKNGFKDFQERLNEAGDMLQQFGKDVGMLAGIFVDAIPALEWSFRILIESLNGLRTGIEYVLDMIGLGPKDHDTGKKDKDGKEIIAHTDYAKNLSGFATVAAAVAGGLFLKHRIGKWMQMEMLSVRAGVVNIGGEDLKGLMSQMLGKNGRSSVHGTGFANEQMEFFPDESNVAKSTTRIGRFKALGSRLFSRAFGNFSVGRGLLGMAVSGIANDLVSELPAFRGKSVIQSAITGAGIGYMFGPQGAFIGALVGIISSSLHSATESLKDPKNWPADSPFWDRLPKSEQMKYQNSPESRKARGDDKYNPNPYHWWNPGSWLYQKPTGANQMMQPQVAGTAPMDPGAVAPRLQKVNEELADDQEKARKALGEGGPPSAQLLKEIRDLLKQQKDLQEAQAKLLHKGNMQRGDQKNSGHPLAVPAR